MVSFLKQLLEKLFKVVSFLKQLLEKLFLLVSFLNKEKTFLFKHYNPATKAF
ncbi:hypothetical protein MNB_SUP05-SYMBIONT-4-1338 [hydrothermal vent metagenome]|uniref:Uncharacterized protein n=1 Tax=hydrothermal vent metagenome TaxID=652676 RepID=A0A1W1DZR6_9ZZZZ